MKINDTVKFTQFGKTFEGTVKAFFTVETTDERYASLVCIYSGKKFSAPIQDLKIV